MSLPTKSEGRSLTLLIEVDEVVDGNDGMVNSAFFITLFPSPPIAREQLHLGFLSLLLELGFKILAMRFRYFIYLMSTMFLGTTLEASSPAMLTDVDLFFPSEVTKKC